MAILTVNAKRQVTFKKEDLQHLGIKPGDKIELDFLPDGRGILKAAKPSGHISDFIGFLEGKTKKVASLEEIQEAIEQEWAGEK